MNDLADQSKFIYQDQWTEYKERKATGIVIIFPLVFCILGVLVFINLYPQFGRWLILAFVIAVAFIALILRPQPKGFSCPRCALNFDPHKGINLGKKCVNCGLPRYYGSTYFRDYWGEDHAKKMTADIARDEK